jgi:hypothetical protein
MKIIVIDGVQYEANSDAHLAKIQADAVAAVKVATDRADQQEARADKAEADLTAARASLAVDALDARVESRFALLTRAARLLPATYETKGKTDAQVRHDAVSAKIGADKLIGKSEVYVEYAFDALTDVSETDKATFHNPLKDGVPAKPVSRDDSDEAFRAALAKKDETK